jgi:hypothetical protein
MIYLKFKKGILLSALIAIILLWPVGAGKIAGAATFTEGVKGYILLQVEANGEAWYVYPRTQERYFLGRPAQAFEIMQKLSLGAKHDFITTTETFPESLAGMILLDVELNGEAYYIYPKDLKKYYLGRPTDAFLIMQRLGLGITTQDLTNIPVGNLDEKVGTVTTGEILIANVPFTSQAPFGDWTDQRQQDGCEEASALMAIKWARGESLSKESALSNILGSSEYTQKTYGEYRDISAQDTVDWIIKDYFNYDKVELKKDITIQAIIDELNQDHLVLTPMNGQLLGNPNFTSPGPSRHMVLIRGYNSDQRIFITNDPGTRNGELYKYDYDIFFEAIRAYPTGYHESITAIQKDMIVVQK